MKQSHPKGLYVLFFAEMWERFSFYGMRALLVLYMTKHLFYSDIKSYGVYGAYGALVYAFPVLGGILADRLLGYRNAIILGGLLMALGHFCMAVPNEVAFYCALGLLCLGNGFFKPNVSSIVGKLYAEGDPRRDAGFTIFYMGINLGAFLSPLVCGFIGETFGWHYGFAIAGFGMLAGLGCFIRGQKYLEGHGAPPEPARLKKHLFAGLSTASSLYVACALAVPLIALALKNNQVIGGSLYVVATLILGFLFYTAFTSDKVARGRLLVVIVLMFFHTTFWAFFEQAGSSLQLFSDRNVNLMIFGWRMPASLTQSLNPLFIIALAPLFSKMWIALQARRAQPSIPVKFIWGLIQVGLGFGALVVGAMFAKNGITALIWLVLAYLLHTTAELCLSPVGLSAVTKLAPAKAVGTVMGAWFLSMSFGQHFAAAIAKLTQVQSEASLGALINPVQSLAAYTGVFRDICWVALGVAGILLLFTPFLKRWMHGVE